MHTRILLCLALLIGAATTVHATPTKDATGTVKTETLSAANAQSQTVSYAVSAGSDRLLMVRVSYDTEGADLSGTTVTYGGVSLTLLDTQTSAVSADQGVQIWYLIAPTVGTANVVIDLASTTEFSHCLSVIDAWAGVDQTTPFGTTTKIAETAGSFTSTSISVASVADDLVVDVIATFFNGVITITNGAGQSSDAEEENNNIITTGASREIAVGTSTDLEWTFSTAVTGYRTIGVAMKQVGGAAATGGGQMLRGCCQ